MHVSWLCDLLEKLAQQTIEEHKKRSQAFSTAASICKVHVMIIRFSFSPNRSRAPNRMEMRFTRLRRSSLVRLIEEVAIRARPTIFFSAETQIDTVAKTRLWKQNVRIWLDPTQSRTYHFEARCSTQFIFLTPPRTLIHLFNKQITKNST